MHVYLTRKKIEKKKVFLFLYNMKNQETRLCGNERLKVDFFEFCSVERTFVFVAVEEEEDDDDDDDDGFILLISCIIELLFDGNID